MLWKYRDLKVVEPLPTPSTRVSLKALQPLRPHRLRLRSPPVEEEEVVAPAMDLLLRLSQQLKATRWVAASGGSMHCCTALIACCMLCP